MKTRYFKFLIVFGVCLSCAWSTQAQTYGPGDWQYWYEGQLTQFTGNTAYFFFNRETTGSWTVSGSTGSITNMYADNQNGFLRFDVISAGTLFIGYGNAPLSMTVNLIATPATPDAPYVDSYPCGQVLIRQYTQNIPGGVDWYWQDDPNGYSTSIGTADIRYVTGGQYWLRARSHDHPDIWSGISAPVTATPRALPTAAFNFSSASTCYRYDGGSNYIGGSSTGIGTPSYDVSLDGGSSWTVINGQTGSSFSYNPAGPGNYKFRVRRSTAECGFSAAAYMDYAVMAPTLLGAADMVVGTAGFKACVGDRIAVTLVNMPSGTTPNFNVTGNWDPNASTHTFEKYNDTPAFSANDPLGFIVDSPGEWHIQMQVNGTCGLSTQMATSSFSVWPRPSAPTNLNPGFVCGGNEVTLTGTPGSGGVGVVWYTTATGGTPKNIFPYNFSLPITSGVLNANTDFWAVSWSDKGCESTPRTKHTINVASKPVDNNISASASTICLGQTVTIQSSGGVGVPHYFFNNTGGGFTEITSAIGLTSFPHTPDVPGATTYWVRNDNGCGYCGSPNVVCSYNKIVVVSVVEKSKVSPITGEVLVVPQKAYTYSITPQNATGIVWTVSNGTVVSGQGTSTITATFQNGSGTVSVAVSNATCGAGETSTLEVRQGLNYIIDESPQVPLITNITGVAGLDEYGKIKSTQFFDGLGRPNQTVSMKSTPGHLDLNKPQLYDKYGRTERDFLPFSAGTDGFYKANEDFTNTLTGAYTGIAQPFYSNSSGPVAYDLIPSAKTIFEPSPLNRVIEQGSHGTPWQPDGVNSYGSTDRTIKKLDKINDTNDNVLIWTLDAPSTTYPFGIVKIGTGPSPYYDPKFLSKKMTKDEHYNEVIEYIDKEGHTILKRVQAVAGTVAVNNDNYASTYYIYDALSRLVCVIPPEASKKLANEYYQGGATDVTMDDFLKRWAFRYKYDARKRITMKQVPGAAPVYMVYDRRDRLVMTQDGNQRSGATMYWSFTKYDVLNRPILTGMWNTTTLFTQADMQTIVDGYYAVDGSGNLTTANAAWGESYVGTAGGNVHGYSNNSYPTYTSTSNEVDPNKYLTVTYYDNYNFRSPWVGYNYLSDNLTATVNGVPYSQPSAENTSLNGHATGAKTKVLDGGVVGGTTWLKSVTYYDDKYRVIQTLADNIKGGNDRVSSLFDFAGKVLTTQTTHFQQDITVKDLVKVNVTGNKYTNTSASSGWGLSGGASVQQLGAGQDGWVEITVSSGTAWAVGFSDSNPDAALSTVDFGIGVNGGNVITCENALNAAYCVIRGAVTIGDVLRVHRTGTTIKYYKNGTFLANGGSSSSTALLVDFAMYTAGHSLTNVTSSAAQVSHTVTRRFDYDHAGRLLRIWHKADTQSEVLEVQNEYNELGQLLKKKLHGLIDPGINQAGTTYSPSSLTVTSYTGPSAAIARNAVTLDPGFDTGTNGKFLARIEYTETNPAPGGVVYKPAQVVDYRYNIRGWLTKINNGDLTPGTTGDPKDYFGMDLAYNATADGQGGNQFNGNISAVNWSVNLGLAALKQRTYGYGYDPLNRILTAAQKEKAASWASTSAFSENGYSYDLNGNIQGLTRNGVGGAPMDILVYNYGTAVSNQLAKVTDSGDQTKGFIEPSSTSGNDYTYDANGNMITDQNKGLTGITYNFLNLPEVVAKGTNKINYSYDATGRKLSQTVSFTGTQKASDYAGEFFYENDTLRFVNTDEGRVVMDQSAEQDALVAEYNLDGNADDQSGNGLTGALYGGAATTTDRNGTAGKAIQLDGTDDYVGVPNNAAFNFGSQNFTVSFWVKKLANTVNWDNGMGVCKWNTGASAGTNSWSVGMGGQNDNIPGFAVESGNTVYQAFGTTNMVLNQWYFLKGVREGNMLKVYVNGVLEGTAALPSATTAVNTTTLPVYIGRLPSGYYSNAVFDEVQIIHQSTTHTSVSEYQYHLKDQLGNVRLTFTTLNTADGATGTLEDANAGAEQSKFLRYTDARRVYAELFDHTNGKVSPGYAERLNGSASEKFGIARSLSVMPGDTIRAEVYGKYVEADNGVNWDAAFRTLMQQVSSTTAGVVVDGTNYATSTSSFPFSGLLSTAGSVGGPKAYLNWVVFDRDYNFIASQSGFKRMTNIPAEHGQNIDHELLASPDVIIGQAGYVYIYLSNEEPTNAPVEVYFDDLKVTLLKGPVIQTDDYYPFGLKYNSYARENSMPNRLKLFQGQEHIDDLGLNWDSFKWRNHQPDIGRFFGVDKLSEKYYFNSPYAFSENKVVRHIELEGLESVELYKKIIRSERVQSSIRAANESAANTVKLDGGLQAAGLGGGIKAGPLQGGFAARLAPVNGSLTPGNTTVSASAITIAAGIKAPMTDIGGHVSVLNGNANISNVDKSVTTSGSVVDGSFKAQLPTGGTPENLAVSHTNEGQTVSANSNGEVGVTAVIGNVWASVTVNVLNAVDAVQNTVQALGNFMGSVADSMAHPDQYVVPQDVSEKLPEH